MSYLAEKYAFKEYDPAYPSFFGRQKAHLHSHLGNDVHIEHIGSTSVPGLGGKGVIDIYVVAPLGPLEPYSAALEQAGYEFRPQAGIADRWFFKAVVTEADGKTRLYQVHLVSRGNPDYSKDIAFRDWLRTHQADRDRYEGVKRIAARVANGNPRIYKDMKAAIMAEIIESAVSACVNTSRE